MSLHEFFNEERKKREDEEERKKILSEHLDMSPDGGEWEPSTTADYFAVAGIVFAFLVSVFYMVITRIPQK